jgi:hypothetical protein
MSSLMMALVRRNMYERLTKHHNKVVILVHLLVFYKDISELVGLRSPAACLCCENNHYRSVSGPSPLPCDIIRQAN